jgi:hypothetical protein
MKQALSSGIELTETPTAEEAQQWYVELSYFHLNLSHHTWC